MTKEQTRQHPDIFTCVRAGDGMRRLSRTPTAALPWSLLRRFNQAADRDRFQCLVPTIAPPSQCLPSDSGNEFVVPFYKCFERQGVTLIGGYTRNPMLSGSIAPLTRTRWTCREICRSPAWAHSIGSWLEGPVFYDAVTPPPGLKSLLQYPAHSQAEHQSIGLCPPLLCSGVLQWRGNS